MNNIFYYSEDKENSFDNRIDADMHQDPCFLYYYDKEFASSDWKTEPKKSLKELYKERAEQIRAKYEYLILAFSGGHDSTQVLETFYYNNIHIDEILLVGAYSKDAYAGDDTNHNAEIFKSAIPILNKMDLKNTKITMFDYTTLLDNIDNFSIIKEYGTDWVKHIGSYYSIHTFFWNDLKKHVGISNDKNTGVIFGSDKPNFQFDSITNTCYTQFSDIGIFSYGNFQKDKNFERVNFYISTDSIDLMKKQLHIIMNFFIKIVFVEKTLTVKQFYDNYSNIIHRLVYDLKNPILFTSPKSPNNILSLRDTYLIGQKNTSIYKIYVDGIKKINNLHQKMKLNSFSDGFFTSNSHFITSRYNISLPLTIY